MKIKKCLRQCLPELCVLALRAARAAQPRVLPQAPLHRNPPQQAHLLQRQKAALQPSPQPLRRAPLSAAR